MLKSIYFMIFNLTLFFVNDGENIEKMDTQSLVIQSIMYKGYNVFGKYKVDYEDEKVKIDLPDYEWFGHVSDHNISSSGLFAGGFYELDTKNGYEKGIKYMATFSQLKAFYGKDYEKFQNMEIKDCKKPKQKNIKFQNFDTIALSCLKGYLNQNTLSYKKGDEIRYIKLIIPSQKTFIAYFPYKDGDENSKHFKRFVNSFEFKSSEKGTK